MTTRSLLSEDFAARVQAAQTARGKVIGTPGAMHEQRTTSDEHMRGCESILSGTRRWNIGRAFIHLGKAQFVRHDTLPVVKTARLLQAPLCHVDIALDHFKSVLQCNTVRDKGGSLWSFERRWLLHGVLAQAWTHTAQ